MRFIGFLFFLAVLAALGGAGWWYATVPQPAKPADQILYLKDEILCKLAAIRTTEPQNPSEALTLYEPLANGGNLVAQINMAQILFAQGITDPQAYTQAVAYLKSPVEAGLPLAQNAYGVAVRDGLGGTTKDKIEAYKWFDLAAQRGLLLARENALGLSHDMTAADVTEAERRADAWLLQYNGSK